MFGGKDTGGKPRKQKQSTGSIPRRGPLDAGADPDGFLGSNRTHQPRAGPEDEEILRLPRLPTPDERREVALESQRGPPQSSIQAPLQPLNSARGGKPPPPQPSDARGRAATLRGDENASYRDEDDEALDVAGDLRHRPPAGMSDAGPAVGGDQESKSWSGSDAAGGRRRDDGDGRLVELESRSDGRAWEEGPPELEKDPIAQACRSRQRAAARVEKAHGRFHTLAPRTRRRLALPTRPCGAVRIPYRGRTACDCGVYRAPPLCSSAGGEVAIAGLPAPAA